VAQLRISGLAFVTDDVAKCSKCNTFLLIMDSYHPVTYIFRKLPSIELTLSSNWHRLTVFEIFAVKWLFRGPNTDPRSLIGLAFGDP